MELAILKGDGTIIVRRCTLADTPLARFRGLMGRKRLGEDEGMLLATSSIHTSFMRFAIDAVFLDRNLKVVRVVQALKPWRLAVSRPAHAVLELPAGTALRAGVAPGEQLSFVANAAARTADVAGGAAPARVAIASSDSRFLRVSGFLLERHGFEVETFRQTGDAVRSAADGRFAAVIVDGSGSLSAAARVIRSLSAESPSTRVVVVGDAGERNGSGLAQPSSLRVVPKWEGFERLVQEIQIASGTGRGHELV